MFIISRCLLGFNCKYNGGNNLNEDLVEFCRTHDYVTVCPETAAGLETPRLPAEIVSVEIIDDKDVFKVVNKDGVDVSDVFDYGARLSLASVLVEAGSRKEHAGIIEGAILRPTALRAAQASCMTGPLQGRLPEDSVFSQTN